MPRQPSRREFLSGIAALTTGGIGYTLASNKATAQTNLNITEFNIPDKDKEIVNPVASVRLSTTAQYSLSAQKVPTRVILRVEGKRSGDYTQLAATELNGLEKEMSGSKELQSNLLDLPNLSAPELSPSTRGESKSVDLSIKLTLTVKRDGAKLSENSVEDMVTINTTKGTASADIQLGGSGSVAISES